jgi:hypothetical protein
VLETLDASREGRVHGEASVRRPLQGGGARAHGAGKGAGREVLRREVRRVAGGEQGHHGRGEAELERGFSCWFPWPASYCMGAECHGEEEDRAAARQGRETA